VLDAVASTNAELAGLARSGGDAGAVLVAEEQTAGRGRLDRTWTAPPRSGLTFSVLLRPAAVAAPAWGWFPLLAGVAVAEAVGALAELTVRLKWPNDVLVEDRKLAGILAERADDALVLGVGLNVTLSEAELPVPTATSLAVEESAVVDRPTLLLAVLRGIGARYEAFLAAGGDAQRSGLAPAYRKLCGTLGRTVRAEVPGGRTVTGTATDVDGTGRLVVQTPDGREVLGAGDVVHVR
jgi:BirA family transcriptional regulator, biotin operon repressor / biotin---[acetyl-CoA-carboxylase] ligase